MAESLSSADFPMLDTAGAVHMQVANGVVHVRFGHPKSNSLPGSVLAKLADTIARAGARDDARVVLLSSYGSGAFCAGASFDELAAIQDERQGTEFFMGFARVILAMTRCPLPIVTRVHGKAVGGGVGIVAASDYCVAARTASLRLSELAVGIGPFVVGPAIEHRIGAGAFAAMAIDADWRDAAWGGQHGLYAQLCESQELDATVDALVGRLASSNPDALQQIKRITWQGTGHWDQLLSDRAAVSGSLVLSTFARDAIARFSAR
jgi:methylglutaconyl-CoA hydratase